MTKTSYICDRCRKEASEAEAIHCHVWLSPPMVPNDSGQLDFCSWNCMSEWASQQERKEKPAIV